MTTLKLIKRYIWLVNTIRQAKRISFADILQKWEATGFSMKTTLTIPLFDQYIEDIKDIFNINIKFDREEERYYIVNVEDLYEDTMKHWVLSALTLYDMTKLGKMMTDRILMQSIPCDGHLPQLLEAMKNRVCLEVRYRRYGMKVETVSDFEPYCLKLINQRWYVLAHFHRDATDKMEERDYYDIYPLDRIREIRLMDRNFEIHRDFNAQNFFEECFGVMVEDGTPLEHIVLRAYGTQRFYLHDQPLHFTQTVKGCGEDYADFQMTLRPTSDFCSHILGLGAHVKVLEPQSLADKIRQMHEEATHLYK